MVDDKFSTPSTSEPQRRPHRQNVCLRRYRTDILVHLWPWPLIYDLEKHFSNFHSYMADIYSKFHWHQSSKYRDIASRVLHALTMATDGRTNGWRDARPRNIMPLSPTVGWDMKRDESSKDSSVKRSVQCVSEDCVLLQSIRNTSIAPTWQYRL